MIDLADPQLGEAEYERVQRVLASGQLADGPEVRSFEAEFATYAGTTEAVATANGTAALHAALEAVGIGDGDRVLTTPFTFIATANAIQFAGAEPVFADVDPHTYNLDPDAAAARIDDLDGGVDAIVPVHLFGLPADVDRFRDLAAAHDAALVEDAAQAHGATVGGERVGSLGDCACFSFYPTKNMTTGEGGMVTTDDAGIADRTRRFVDHGRTEGYEHVAVGHNFRLSSVAAAIGRAQLEKVHEYTRHRRRFAEYYDRAFADLPLQTPTVPDGRTHVYNQYTVRCEQRDALADHLEDAGIGTGVYYPTPLHEQAVYDDTDRSFPVAERAADEVLSLPVHPNLTADDVRTVADAVEGFYA
jgi:perosamine synthetase